MRTVLLPVGGRSTVAVCCPGNGKTDCGTQLTRPGVCPWCARRLTEAEYDAAVAARAGQVAA